jgi:shikimate dehydrogenase
MTTPPPKACVVGWPIEHSRSPLIHTYWLKKYNIAGAYERVAVPPQDIEAFLESLAANGYIGCNVTVPFKEVAYRLLDHADPMAERLKAANTLWLDDGRLCGGNTDVHGFLANMDEEAPAWRDADGPAVILGAGGAARAIAAGLADLARRPLRVVNRTPARAEALLRELRIDGDIFDWADCGRALDGAHLLVNATSLGMAGAPSLDIDLAPLDESAIVADIVYAPLTTELLTAASERGHRTAGGLGMLIYQAAPGFARWFGRWPEVTNELRELLRRDIEGK